MKMGDLVKMKDCKQFDDVLHPLNEVCKCFFCAGKSNRVGVVLSPGTQNSWIVMFDCGEWRVDDFDEARGALEVISVSK